VFICFSRSVTFSLAGCARLANDYNTNGVGGIYFTEKWVGFLRASRVGIDQKREVIVYKNTTCGNFAISINQSRFRSLVEESILVSERE
jgi:hypothetical protein